MQKGDILGHEFMGVVDEMGPAVKGLNKDDRVVVSFQIACGEVCEFLSYPTSLFVGNRARR